MHRLFLPARLWIVTFVALALLSSAAKGHPLVWACWSGVPRWLEGRPVEQTEELSRARVTNIVWGRAGETRGASALPSM